MSDTTRPADVLPMSTPADYYDMSRIRPAVQEALAKINAMGPTFAARAKAVDDEASFPTANYKDLADAGQKSRARLTPGSLAPPVRDNITRHDAAVWVDAIDHIGQTVVADLIHHRPYPLVA